MEPILDFVAEIALWGSFALILWGGMLTLQQIFGWEFERERPRAAADRGELAEPGRRASLAN